MAQVDKVIESIEGTIDEFAETLTKLQKEAFEEVVAILKDLSLDAQGKIKVTVENLKTIQKARVKLEDIIFTKEYANLLKDIKPAFNELTSIQTDYFKTEFKEFISFPSQRELEKISLRSTVNSLSEAGINENVIDKAVDIIEDNIRTNASFTTLTREFEDFIIGTKEADGRLLSYSKQIMNDSMSQYAANYNKLLSDNLETEWFEYVGGLVRDSRPLCRALVSKQFIHRSELGAVARGVVDGRTEFDGESMKKGMIPGTNSQNFIVNRGGYNCFHLLMPIPKERVPKEIRNRFTEE